MAFPAQSVQYRLEGSGLCGTSCGNSSYQNLVGVDYNAAPNRPVDYSDATSYAPYYSGAVLAGDDGGGFSGPYATVDLAPCSVLGTNSGGLQCAVNNFTLGTTASIAAAFAWIDNDIRQGAINGSLGGETLKNSIRPVRNGQRS